MLGGHSRVSGGRAEAFSLSGVDELSGESRYRLTLGKVIIPREEEHEGSCWCFLAADEGGRGEATLLIVMCLRARGVWMCDFVFGVLCHIYVLRCAVCLRSLEKCVSSSGVLQQCLRISTVL